MRRVFWSAQEPNPCVGRTLLLGALPLTFTCANLAMLACPEKASFPNQKQLQSQLQKRWDKSVRPTRLGHGSAKLKISLPAAMATYCLL